MTKLISTTAMVGARTARQIEMPLALITVSSCRDLRSASPRMAPISTVTGSVLIVQRTALIATMTIAIKVPACSETTVNRQVSSDSASAISP